jgi:beta-galactosidase
VQIGEMIADRLVAEADTSDLVEGDTYDVASIRIRAVDQDGNTLPLFMEPVTLAVTGALEVIGPSVLALRGGLGGTYVRTTGGPGPGSLTIRCGSLPDVTLPFVVKSKDR